MAVHQAHITDQGGGCCTERRSKCGQSPVCGRAASHPSWVPGRRGRFARSDSKGNSRETAAVATDTAVWLCRISQCVLTGSTAKWVADIASTKLCFSAVGVKASLPWSIVEQLPASPAGHERRQRRLQRQSHFVTRKWIGAADSSSPISSASPGHQSHIARRRRPHFHRDGAGFAYSCHSALC